VGEGEDLSGLNSGEDRAGGEPGKTVRRRLRGLAEKEKLFKIWLNPGSGLEAESRGKSLRRKGFEDGGRGRKTYGAVIAGTYFLHEKFLLTGPVEGRGSRPKKMNQCFDLTKGWIKRVILRRRKRSTTHKRHLPVPERTLRDRLGGGEGGGCRTSET